MTIIQNRLAIYSVPLCLLLISCGGGKPKTTDHSEPAKIEIFKLEPSKITAGDSAKLTVKYSQGVGELSLDQGEPEKVETKAIPSVWENTFTQAKTTTFTLLVKGPNPDLNAKESLTLTVYPKPIATIEAPESVAPGQKECMASVPEQEGTFTWSIDNGGVITEGEKARAIKFTAPESGSLNLTCTVANPLGVETTTTQTVQIQKGVAKIDVMGLPTETPKGVIRIKGSGIDQELNGSQNFTELKPGIYTVSAKDFIYQGMTHYPWQPEQTFEVKANETAKVTVQYPLPLYIVMIHDTTQKGRFIPMEFVLLPAGKFDMGYSQSNPKPIYQAEFKTAFYMARTECTQAQWRAVMGGDLQPDDGNKPAAGLTWNIINSPFLLSLNEAFPNHDFALPTEAQWEYACKAGSTKDYFCGNEPSTLDLYAWTKQNASNATHPVAEKESNAWGLFDMAGNVWEWCQDEWHDVPGSSVAGKNPALHVIRGGSYYDDPTSGVHRSTFRTRLDETQNPAVGFRLTLNQPQFTQGSILNNKGTGREYQHIGELIPVDPTATYRVSMEVLAHPKIANAISYLGVAEYDEDENLIDPVHHMYRPGTTTTLKRNLALNERVIYLEDTSAWHQSKEAYQRRFIIWNWTSTKGTTFDSGTYSRNISEGNAWNDSITFNKEEHCIELNRPWGEIYPHPLTAGTELSQADAGLSFKYCALNGQKLSKNWKSYQGTIGGIDVSGRNPMDKFCKATRFVKFVVLTGFNNQAGERVWFHNFQIEKVK